MKIQKSDLIKFKQNQQKIVCLTAYSFPIAKIIDNFCEIILVGDSLGMTIYGASNTIEVSLETMINHSKAVVKAVKHSFVVVDLPFGTYENSPQQALETAKKVILETGCDAIKIETPRNLIATVDFLVKNNIPTIAHIGLMPQSIDKIGSYKYQGKDKQTADLLIEDSIMIANAGAIAIVIEAVPASLASEITKTIKIPTIGIGASADCDGQILVIDDLLGLNQEFKPRFVENYCNLASIIENAVSKFSCDVKNGNFPQSKHLFQ